MKATVAHLFSSLQTNLLLDLRSKIADSHMPWSVCVCECVCVCNQMEKKDSVHKSRGLVAKVKDTGANG